MKGEVLRKWERKWIQEKNLKKINAGKLVIVVNIEPKN